MPQICRVCSHPKKAKIEAEIIAERTGKAKIGAQFGVSEKSVRNHAKNCMNALDVLKGQVIVEANDRQNFYQEIGTLKAETREIQQEARQKGKDETALKAIDVQHKLTISERDTAILQKTMEAAEEGLKIEIELVGGPDADSPSTDQ
jgi:hypothetical protein